MPKGVEKVASLVLITKHTTRPTTPDEELIVDIDLAILGKPQAKFDACESAIRSEHAHVRPSRFSTRASGDSPTTP